MPEDMAKKQERTPNKTREREDGQGDSPGKAAKIDKFIPQSNLPERLNLSMKITNLKKGMLASLQIRTDNNVLYIVNENPTDVISLEPGFIVCGFGEGKFKHMAKTAGADDPQGKAVLFSMTSSEDFVILNGRWVKVGQVIRQRQNTQPSAKVAYHETRENVKAEDLTYLVFERVNDIYFIPGKTNVEAGEQEKGQEIKAAEDAKTQNGCMSLLPASAWTKLTNAKVAWSTRWTVKGLLPVRPHIMLTVSVDLPAGHGFSL